MSLQIWLPLNGNLKNRGCDEVQVTSGTVQYLNTGKLGKCANLASRVMFRSTALANMTNENFSVAFWVRTDTSSSLTGNWVDILGIQDLNTNKSGTGTFRFEACYGSNLRACSWHDNENYNTVNGSVVCVPDSEKGKWHHVCVTMSNGSSVTYRDGVSIGTTTTVAGGYFNGVFYIGETNAIAGGINDLRIYNHALSVAEVKELAKGLVCHYKLDDYKGLPNLVSNSKTFSGWSAASGWTQVTTDNGSVGYRFTRTGATSNNWVRLIPTLRVNGNDYPNGITVSLDLLTPSKADINQKCIGSIQTYQESGSRIGWAEPGWDLTNVVDGKWSRISYTFSQTQLLVNNTSGTTYSYTQFSFQLVQNGDITIRNIKIEGGNVSTLYIPNSSDAEYKALGYDSTTITDCSGYGYNGTKSGTLTPSTDTARYNLSTKFVDNNSNIAVTPFLNNGQTVNEISVSCWYKTNTLNNTAPNLWSLGENLFLRLRLANATNIWFYARVGSTMKGYSYSANKTLTDNTWHHVVLTFKNGVFALYVDNVQIGAPDVSDTATYLTCSSTAWHLAGYSTSSEKFVGLLSDFRIYATALTADDVRKLYTRVASTFKGGALLGYEFNEVT